MSGTKDVLKAQRYWILGVFLLTVLSGCEEGLIDQSRIETSDRRTIAGRIELDRDADPSGVYVWLQGTSLHAWTDSVGAYRIDLPEIDGVSGVPTSGVFTLFFYVANYRLASARVLIQGGQVQFGRADVDPQGRVVRPHQMIKKLEVVVSVTPGSIAQNHHGQLHIALSMVAIDDSVEVVFPKMAGNALGAIFFQRLSDGAVFAEISDIDVQNRISFKIGPEPMEWSADLPYAPGMLAPGTYRVVPYFLIEDPELPTGLIESLGPRAQLFDPQFLNIPFKRREAILTVYPDQ